MLVASHHSHHTLMSINILGISTLENSKIDVLFYFHCIWYWCSVVEYYNHKLWATQRQKEKFFFLISCSLHAAILQFFFCLIEDRNWQPLWEKLWKFSVIFVRKCCKNWEKKVKNCLRKMLNLKVLRHIFQIFEDFFHKKINLNLFLIDGIQKLNQIV